jgi:hypothetical protein
MAVHDEVDVARPVMVLNVRDQRLTRVERAAVENHRLEGAGLAEAECYGVAAARAVADGEEIDLEAHRTGVP